ncbi:MAG: hypothetical protein RSC57_02660, partial [Bacilli bacterium]
MNQDLINDLNNILGVMPNATNANPTINEDVLGNLEDLVNSLPNLDGTLDVNTPEEDPVSLKDIISLYNATIDGLEENEKIKLVDEIFKLQQREKKYKNEREENEKNFKYDARILNVLST